MTWDPSLDGFIAVLANSSYGPSGSVPAWTFLYRSGRWSNLSSSLELPATPSSGQGAYTAALAWDAASNYVVLVTGCDAAGSTSAVKKSPQDFTWTFSGSVWTNVSGSSVIPNLYSEGGLSLTWDTGDSELVLEGATNHWATANGLALTTTYTFADGVWTNRTPTWSGPCTGAVSSPCVPSTPEPPGNDGGQFLSAWGNGVVDLGGDNLSQTCYYSPYVWFWQDNRWSNVTSGGNWPLNGNCAGTGSLKVWDPISSQMDISGNSYELIGGTVGPDTVVTFGGTALFGSTYASPMNLTGWCLGGLSNCPLLSYAVTGPAPSNVTSVSGSGASCGEIRLLWTNPTPPSYASLVNDTVDVFHDGALVYSVSAGGPFSSATVMGLSCGTADTCSVQAWFSTGQVSPASAGVLCATAGAVGLFGFLSSITASSLDLALIIFIALAVVIAYALTRHRHGGGRRVGGRK